MPQPYFLRLQGAEQFDPEVPTMVLVTALMTGRMMERNARLAFERGMALLKGWMKEEHLGHLMD